MCICNHLYILYIFSMYIYISNLYISILSYTPCKAVRCQPHYIFIHFPCSPRVSNGQRPGRVAHVSWLSAQHLPAASRQVSFTCASMWDASPSLRHSFESARDTCSLQLESPSVSCLKSFDVRGCEGKGFNITISLVGPWPHSQRLRFVSLYDITI